MKLGTILTAMITPFDEHDNLAIAEAQKIARWLIDRGNDGLVVAGSTGEGQTLDRAERSALWAAVKDAVGSRAAVIANAGTASTRESIAFAEDAAAAGADAILAVVPPYIKPTQTGMRRHFGAIAEAAGELPIVIYNIPGRTGANMLPETLLQLASDHANIAGVKESSGDLGQIATIVAGRRDGFLVWAGDDHLFLPCLAVGADGLVGVASHLCSPEYSANVRCVPRGARRRGGANSRKPAPALRRALCHDQSDSDQVGDESSRLSCRLVPPAARRYAGRACGSLTPVGRAVRGGPGRGVDRVEILGCKLDVLDANEAAAQIMTFAREGAGAQVVTLGTEMVVHAQKDERFRDVVNASALSLCDTVGVLSVARRRGANAARARHRRRIGRASVRAVCARGLAGVFPGRRRGCGRGRGCDHGSAVSRAGRLRHA